ncbi:MAG: tetratricopeptide repeat protein [Polyangiaceae bacterium]|jgi:Flp pilus assembly protein TadD
MASKSTGPTKATKEEREDAARWEAVEEATELLHEERFREAMVELRSVLEEDPKNAYAYYFLGIAFFEIGELEPARDAYGAAIKLAPGHMGARVALAHVLRILGDIRGSLREGLAALARVPADPDALHAVGLAYHARGDEKAARKYLEAFLDTHPELEVGAEVQALLASFPDGEKPPPEDD